MCIRDRPGTTARTAASAPPGAQSTAAPTGPSGSGPERSGRASTANTSSPRRRSTVAEAVALLPALDLPAPTVLPLERFAEGLELYRSGEALKVVFTP